MKEKGEGKIEVLIKLVYEKAKKETYNDSKRSLAIQVETITENIFPLGISSNTVIKYFNRHIFKLKGSSPDPQNQEKLKEYLKVKVKDVEYGDLGIKLFKTDINEIKTVYDLFEIILKKDVIDNRILSFIDTDFLVLAKDYEDAYFALINTFIISLIKLPDKSKIDFLKLSVIEQREEKFKKRAFLGLLLYLTTIHLEKKKTDFINKNLLFFIKDSYYLSLAQSFFIVFFKNTEADFDAHKNSLDVTTNFWNLTFPFSKQNNLVIENYTLINQRLGAEEIFQLIKSQVSYSEINKIDLFIKIAKNDNSDMEIKLLLKKEKQHLKETSILSNINELECFNFLHEIIFFLSFKDYFILKKDYKVHNSSFFYARFFKSNLIVLERSSSNPNFFEEIQEFYKKHKTHSIEERFSYAIAKLKYNNEPDEIFNLIEIQETFEEEQDYLIRHKWSEIGDLLFEKGINEQAILCYRKSLSHFKSISVFSSIIKVYIECNNLKKAKEILDNALSIYPDSDELLSDYGNLYLVNTEINEQRIDLAYYSYCSSLENNPFNYKAMIGMVRIAYKKYEFKLALQKLDLIKKGYSLTKELEYLEVIILLELKKFAEAKKIINKITNQDHYGYFLYMRLLWEQNKLLEFKKITDDILEMHQIPEEGQVYYYLGLYYIKQNNFPLALYNFSISEEKGFYHVKLFYNTGMAFLKIRRIGDAKNYLSKALRHCSSIEFLKVKIGLTIINTILGDYSTSIVFLKQTLYSVYVDYNAQSPNLFFQDLQKYFLQGIDIIQAYEPTEHNKHINNMKELVVNFEEKFKN